MAIKNGRQGKRAKNAQGKLSKGPQPRQDQAQRCANGHPTKTFSSGSISDAIRVLGGLQWSSASPAPAALEQVKADPDPLLILKPTPPQRIARPDVRVWTPQRTLATRAGYDTLRNGEIMVFEPDLSALVRRSGKAVVVDLQQYPLSGKRCSAACN